MHTKELPTPPGFSDEAYVHSLLNFATSHELFQKLCGGVHILDFLTQEPDLYSALLPQGWREWFAEYHIQDILDFLMRAKLEDLNAHDQRLDLAQRPNGAAECADSNGRIEATPPASLTEYIRTIRELTLLRDVSKSDHILDSSENIGLARSVAVGMKPKKIHEVGNFVKYIGELTENINSNSDHSISHVVDFGSGQNYLGRALASPPYCKDVIAIESKHHNIDGAKTMDIIAKLAKKKKVMRNKKDFRMGVRGARNLPSTITDPDERPDSQTESKVCRVDEEQPSEETGSIQYIESMIRTGDLSKIIPLIQGSKHPEAAPCEPQLLVISLHSCGNLLHHGLSSLVLNPPVKAVAMVGCCYNLMTERLGPPTYKLPSLRNPNARLDETSTACDPHGFPMSEHLATYKHKQGQGIRLNITARMMAVQAPQNWTPDDSEAFFTRHFYRALLQRIFVDQGVVGKPPDNLENTGAGSPRGWSGGGHPIILGSLRKSCYISFLAYVRGAMDKLRDDSVLGPRIAKYMDTLTDKDIAGYEQRFNSKKKELSIIWSLMAFSAGVVESIIVVDRWLYLKEQDAVKECWVEAIFDYKQSPRNLVVVGIKR